MDLKSFATPLAAKNRFIKASFGGFAGSGKSRTGSEFCAGAYHDMKLKKPLMILDNEKGARFLEPFFKAQKIDVLLKETVQVADLLQAMKFLQDGEIEFLFVDSLSKIWYQYVRDYKAKNHVTFMALNDWGKILPAWQEEFSDRFVEAQGNIIFTGRGGFTYDMEESDSDDGKKKKNFVKSGVKMKLAGETPFEPDINVWMQVVQKIVKGKPVLTREAQIMKDRSGLIDGKTFVNPTYKDFSPVVKLLMQIPVGEVAGESSKENLAPSEDYGWVQRKREREIEVEKIQASFELAALGTSKEDKQIKAEIFRKFIGTTSATEFEKLPAEKLHLSRINIERLFQRWPEIDPKDRLPFVKNFKLLTEEPTGLENDPSGLFGGLEEEPASTETNGQSEKFKKMMAEGKAATSKSALEKASRTVAALFGSGELTTDENNTLTLFFSNRFQELGAK